MSVYCPNKFDYLKVDIEKRLLYNCHKAHPHRVTTQWLEQNPGMLFNTETMIAERKEMLAGKRNFSCGYQCYNAEDKGAYSHRMQVLDTKKTEYTNPLSFVKTLNIDLSSDCNLSCVYCSGMFSSSWRREIKKFGTYANVPKNYTEIVDNLSQKEKANAPFFQAFLKEIKKMKKLERVIITGGEPFLTNQLDKILDLLDSKIVIDVITGLGVSKSRFNKVLPKLMLRKVKINISAEGLDKHLEFIRHGSDAEQFNSYIKTLENNNIEYKFICTVSNLTMFGLQDFYLKYNSIADLDYNPCQYPTFTQKHIIDPTSKKQMIDFWGQRNDKFSNMIMTGLERNPNLNEMKKLQIYLKQIRERRNVSLDHFPKSFLDWLDL